MAEPAASTSRPASSEPINPENNHSPNEPIVNNRARASGNNNQNANPQEPPPQPQQQQQPVSVSKNINEPFELYDIAIQFTLSIVLESDHQYQGSIIPCIVFQNCDLV